MATEAESGRVRVRVLQLQRYKYGSPSLKAGVPRSAPILFLLFLKRNPFSSYPPCASATSRGFCRITLSA